MKRSIPTLIAALIAASGTQAQKVTYDEHVLPILRNSCLRCHNADKAKADLDLASYKATLKGSGNGAIVKSGDPDGSKLVKAITHAEEPTMPPNGKLPDNEVATIKKWIAEGLLENSGSKAVAMNKPKVDLTAVAPVIGKPDGPPPMPGDLLLDPIVRTERTSVATALAASPWAPLVALGGQHQVLLYNTDTLQFVGLLPFPEGYPCDLKFSRNGKLLVCGGGRASKAGLVAVWDVTTGERILSVGDELDSVLAADISADQKWIVLGGPSRMVKIFSTKDGTLAHKMKKHTEWVTAAEFSPDSKLLATGDRNGGLVVWEADRGEELYTLTGHKAAITSVCWRSPDVLVSASEDGSARIWTMDEGQQAKNWTAHGSGTLALRAAHDGRMVTCGRDHQIAVWSADGGKQRGIPFTNDIPVRATLTHDGGRAIASDWLGNVWVWNTADGKKLGELALNPLSLAEQRRNATAPADVERFKRAEAFASLYRTKENLAKLKADHDKAVAEAAAAEAALKQADADLAAARKSTPKNAKDKSELATRIKTLTAEIKAQTAKLASSKKTAERLVSEQAAEKDRVDKLTADYQKLKSPAPAQPSAKL